MFKIYTILEKNTTCNVFIISGYKKMINSAVVHKIVVNNIDYYIVIVGI